MANDAPAGQALKDRTLRSCESHAAAFFRDAWLSRYFWTSDQS